MNFAPKWTRWQSAELAAQAVERGLRERLMESVRNPGAPDTADEQASVHELRQHVHQLFVEAMDEMACTARALRTVPSHPADGPAPAPPDSTRVDALRFRLADEVTSPVS